jgi:plastocyanin
LGVDRNPAGHYHFECPLFVEDSMFERLAVAILACLILLSPVASGCASPDEPEEEPDMGGADSATMRERIEPGADGETFELVDCGDATIAADVSVVDFEFEPGEPSVGSGEVIRFTIQEMSRHTVTSGRDDAPDSGDLFESGYLESGETFCVRALEAGDFPFYCRIHPISMTGTIRVGS